MSHKLPNADLAILEVLKLRDYCLNPLHPEGRHKARVFAAALGIGRGDAEWFRAEMLAVLCSAPVIRHEPSGFGDRYTVDLDIERNGFTAVVRTAWIVRCGEEIPRFVTCFVV